MCDDESQFHTFADSKSAGQSFNNKCVLPSSMSMRLNVMLPELLVAKSKQSPNINHTSFPTQSANLENHQIRVRESVPSNLTIHTVSMHSLLVFG